jgi:hypothetical protein
MKVPYITLAVNGCIVNVHATPNRKVYIHFLAMTNQLLLAEMKFDTVVIETING